MRLNRGTLILLLASIVVIVLVVALNNQQASAPAPTPEATAEGAGPVFPAIADTTAQETIVRFEAANNDTGERTVMTKDDANVWTIAEATNASELATDQVKAVGTMSILASLEAVESFAAEDLAPFGLDTPTHMLVLTAKDETVYTLKIGSETPGSRYYGQVGDEMKVYILPKQVVDNLIRQMIAVPPYVASPTPTATPTRTPNPLSEVEMTQTAVIEQTLAAEMMTATAQAEMTPEATAEATGETTPEATDAPSPTATRTPSS